MYGLTWIVYAVPSKKKYQLDEIRLNQMNLYETPYEMTDDGLFFILFF